MNLYVLLINFVLLAEESREICPSPDGIAVHTMVSPAHLIITMFSEILKEMCQNKLLDHVTVNKDITEQAVAIWRVPDH